MKYNVGDLIASRDRIGLIVNAKIDLSGQHVYEIEWQFYHSERIMYKNMLFEENIDKMLVLYNSSKHLPVIK
jgi:hypothetical protein